ncbi:MAG: aromatic-ring-hydroxylating dioxygenase subunit beta [Candidatus Tectomicrobia bacterium]|uniref:Aromatic-ring-hydroxylating dioxygenase subunit beta n=1 Tax=Tectimicrobiota bacterium TaxID=2528274 RepID=A0A937W409_UNCTE|nr:aromatic-ring-hydroxylating dioxygenase subunit beta [Candidatus Tectomicrobia bacterium]
MAQENDIVRRAERLTAEYIGCIDDDALERWPQFFTEDGMYRIVSRENYARGMPASFFYCQGQGMMHDRILALRRANIYEPHVYRHMVSGTRLRHEEPGGWRLTTNFHVVRTMHTGEIVVFATGCFEDMLVEREGALLFREKTVICDSSRIDTLLVIPL